MVHLGHGRWRRCWGCNGQCTVFQTTTLTSRAGATILAASVVVVARAKPSLRETAHNQRLLQNISTILLHVNRVNVALI